MSRVDGLHIPGQRRASSSVGTISVWYLSIHARLSLSSLDPQRLVLRSLAAFHAAAAQTLLTSFWSVLARLLCFGYQPRHHL